MAPWLVGGILCLGVGLILSTESSGAWAAQLSGAPPVLARAMTDSAELAFLYSAAAAWGMGLVLIAIRKGFFRKAVALGALTALVALDLARANLSAYPTGPPETITFVPPIVQTLVEREGTTGPGRFRIVPLDWSRYRLPEPLRYSFGVSTASALQHRFALDPGHNVQFHIESAESYLPGISARLAAIYDQQIGVEVAARYNVSYYVGRRFRMRTSLFMGSLVADFPAYDLALFRNPAPVKPRVYLSRHPERAATPLDLTALIARPEFLNGGVDVIETTDPALPGPAMNGSAAIEHYVPEEVRVRVDTPQSAVLILLDAFEKGWGATLDGGPEVPLLRANALMRAVIVPPGTHVVTFSYQTPLLKVGAWLSLTGVLLCTGLIARVPWQQRYSGADA